VKPNNLNPECGQPIDADNIEQKKCINTKKYSQYVIINKVRFLWRNFHLQKIFKPPPPLPYLAVIYFMKCLLNRSVLRPFLNLSSVSIWYRLWSREFQSAGAPAKNQTSELWRREVFFSRPKHKRERLRE
jgi:hypothetical protein